MSLDLKEVIKIATTQLEKAGIEDAEISCFFVIFDIKYAYENDLVILDCKSYFQNGTGAKFSYKTIT